MPKPTNEMKAIDPGDRRIANIHTAPFRTLFSDGVADGEVLQLDTDRPTGRLAPAFTCTAWLPAPRRRPIAILGTRSF